MRVHPESGVRICPGREVHVVPDDVCGVVEIEPSDGVPSYSPKKVLASKWSCEEGQVCGTCVGRAFKKNHTQTISLRPAGWPMNADAVWTATPFFRTEEGLLHVRRRAVPESMNGHREQPWRPWANLPVRSWVTRATLPHPCRNG